MVNFLLKYGFVFTIFKIPRLCEWEKYRKKRQKMRDKDVKMDE